MRSIMMGVVSSKSSSISLDHASSLTGLEGELEAMALKEGDLSIEALEEEMSEECQREIAKRQEIAEKLLRKSSSHLLVTANSSADHLNFIRCSAVPPTFRFGQRRQQGTKSCRMGGGSSVCLSICTSICLSVPLPRASR